MPLSLTLSLSHRPSPLSYLSHSRTSTLTTFSSYLRCDFLLLNPLLKYIFRCFSYCVIFSCGFVSVYLLLKLSLHVCLFFLGWVLQNHSIWDYVFCFVLLRFLLLVKNAGECLIIDWYCYWVPLFYTFFFPSIFVPYYLDFSHSWLWQEYQFHNFSNFFLYFINIWLILIGHHI